MPAVCVVIRGTSLEEVEIDDSPMSPYVHTVLGGRPSFRGAWNDCEIVMLGLEQPPENAEPIPRHMLPSYNCEDTIVGPVVITKLNAEYTPVNFTIDDYHQLLQGNA